MFYQAVQQVLYHNDGLARIFQDISDSCKETCKFHLLYPERHKTRERRSMHYNVARSLAKHLIQFDSNQKVKVGMIFFSLAARGTVALLLFLLDRKTRTEKFQVSFLYFLGHC